MNEEYIFAEEIDEDLAKERRNKYARPENYGLVIVALIMGIISLIFFAFGLNLISSIVAIILAIIYLVTTDSKQGRGMAIAAIITSLLSIVLLIGSWTLVFRNADRLVGLFDEFLVEYDDNYFYDPDVDFEDIDNLPGLFDSEYDNTL